MRRVPSWLFFRVECKSQQHLKPCDCRSEFARQCAQECKNVKVWLVSQTLLLPSSQACRHCPGFEPERCGDEGAFGCHVHGNAGCCSNKKEPRTAGSMSCQRRGFAEELEDQENDPLGVEYFSMDPICSFAQGGGGGYNGRKGVLGFNFFSIFFRR